MRRPYAQIAAVGGAIVALALAAAAPAHAARAVVHTSLQHYVPSQVVVDRGGSLTHTNVDIAPHNVVSTARDAATGEPLFSSGPPQGIGAYEVEGVSSLAPGSYGFICTIHPPMRGTLTVVDASVPVPEPPPVLPDGAVALPTAIVPTPTSLTDFGGHLYVSSYADGAVRRMAIRDGGLLGPPETYAEGFSSPLGIAFAPDGTLFVADSHRSTRPGRTTDGRVWAVAPDGTRSVVVDELPNGRHNTNGMAVRDGRLYIANGNSTDDGVDGGDPEEPLSGTLISVPVGARGLTPASADVVVEARGMRNLYDVAFRPGTSEAWIPMNGPDTFDPWGEDLLLKADVAGEAPDFGFPGCLYAAPPAEPAVKQNPAVADSDPCDGTEVAPEQLLGLHVSANGLDFGPEDAFWGGDLYITEFGNFFGDRPRGHEIVRVPIDAEGRSSAPRTFVVGVAPLDLDFGPPGTGMYVADFATGQITLIRGT
jgi:plastocyanin/glucose/arabinose dehydrogenase